MSEKPEDCLLCDHERLTSELVNGLCEDCEGENLVDCPCCKKIKAESDMIWSDTSGDEICFECTVEEKVAA